MVANNGQMVRRFWEGMLRGGHCGHGETFMDPKDIIWWSHGGILKGESPSRLKFLLEILNEVSGKYLTKGNGMFDEVVGYSGGWTGKGFSICYAYSIHYLEICQSTYRPLALPDDAEYEVDLIDTWNMTIEHLGRMSGFQRINMSGKQYMAIRIRKI